MACFGWGKKNSATAILALITMGCGGSAENDDGGGGDGGGTEVPLTTGGTAASGGSGGSHGGSGNTGGAPAGGSGGASATGGAAATGGAPATGGAAAGGSGGETSVGLYSPLLPLELGDPALAFADIPKTTGIGTCTPPCALELQPNGDASIPADVALLYVDFDAPSVTLSNENAGSAMGYQMRFTYEDNQYGHGSWASGLWWTWTEGEMFDAPDDYSEAVDRIITAQLSSSKNGEILLVAYSHGAEEVRIHWARIPSCTPGAGVCENASDCSAVNTGDTTALSNACGDCYEAAATCSQTHCSDKCPGQGGNVCMNCEVDAGCHTAFMECSGLDYMPMGSLTFPN